VRTPLVLALLLATTYSCMAEHTLIPITHVQVNDVADMLLRGPTLIPRGIVKIWPLPQCDALVVEGDLQAAGKLRELLSLFDRPARRVAIRLSVVVLPVGKSMEDLDLGDSEPKLSHVQLTRRVQAAGAQVHPATADHAVVIANGASKCIWLADRLARLQDPGAIAVGLDITPRVNADGTVTTFLQYTSAAPDPGVGVVTKPFLPGQLTASSGETIWWKAGDIQDGDGTQHNTAVIITITVLPELN